MEIADEVTHQSLAYLTVGSRSGGLTLGQVDAYADSPHRAKARYENAYSAASTSLIAAVMGMQTVVSPGEKMSAYLLRLEWAVLEGGRLKITRLGAAVLAELNQPRINVSNDDPISVIVDPEDPLAYAKIFERIASVDDSLLVDPYLAMPQFFELLSVPGITRILLSDHDIKAKKPPIGQALKALPSAPEVRFLPLKSLHDRFLIPDGGDVLVFGSSLNSITKRPGVVTPITDYAASAAIRKAYAELWAAGTAIQASP